MQLQTKQRGKKILKLKYENTKLECTTTNSNNNDDDKAIFVSNLHVPSIVGHYTFVNI